MRQIEKIVSLQTLDALWKDHLLAMDHLKEGIGLRGYAQQNPLVEYQKEGFSMFESLMEVMQKDIVEKVFSSRCSGSRMSSSPAAGAETATRGNEPWRRKRDNPGGASQKERRGSRRPQRSMPMRIRKEVQAVPRQVMRDAFAAGDLLSRAPDRRDDPDRLRAGSVLDAVFPG